MMKRAFFLVIGSTVLFASPFVYAEDQTPDYYSRPESSERPGMSAAKGKGMMPHKQMIATSDGGIVILSGGRLTKYDAQLSVVNEVELKKEERAEDAPAERTAEQRRRRIFREELPSAEIPTPQFAPEPADSSAVEAESFLPEPAVQETVSQEASEQAPVAVHDTMGAE